MRAEKSRNPQNSFPIVGPRTVVAAEMVLHLALLRPSPSPRAPPPKAALPLVPIVGLLSVATLAGLRKASRERDNFYSMDWSGEAEDSDGEACVLIGEEAAADGKSWFLCQSPAAGADCEPVESFGGGEEELLCKVPKA